MAVALREHPEGVDESGIDEILKSAALLVRESLLAAVRLGIGQIELGVGDVEVAAEYDRLAPLELAAIGEDMRQPYIAKACEWLKAHQQPSGGWGESCASYMDLKSAGLGVTTASQTAWALMALLAANRAEDQQAIDRGLAWLIETQREGSWDEPHYTGTGFPGYGVGQTIKLTDPNLPKRLMQGPELSRAFMLNYGLYRHYFPLMALGRAARARQADAPAPAASSLAPEPPLSGDFRVRGTTSASTSN